MPSARSPAVFFDRDGTLMEEVHYCADPSRVRAIPGVAEALAGLRSAGFLAIVVTNQSGIGRGLLSEAQYHAVHAELVRQLGGNLDAAYFCPDHPDQATARRKPAPGMVLEAARDHALDLAASWLVGDKPDDLACADAAGVTGLLVRTGYGAVAESNLSRRYAVFDDAPAAIRHILQVGGRSA